MARWTVPAALRGDVKGVLHVLRRRQATVFVAEMHVSTFGLPASVLHGRHAHDLVELNWNEVQLSVGVWSSLTSCSCRVVIFLRHRLQF